MFRMTPSDIFRNALNRNYSMDQAASDLGSLLLERELITRRGDTDAPRLRDLEHLIPVQEALALGKPRGDEAFERLKFLDIRLEQA
jgi:hypothetical protein